MLAAVTDQYPVILSESTGVDPTHEEIDQYFQDIETVMENNEGPCISLFDASSGTWMSGSARVYFGRKAKENENKYRDRILFVVIVIDNTVTRMMLKGINLVLKPTIPQIVVKTREEAEVVVQQKLREAQVAA